jgi:cysteine-rich repeat protein
LLLLAASSEDAGAAVVLTDATNARLGGVQVESGGDTSENPDVTSGLGGALVPYTENAGIFTCCLPDFGGGNLDDADVGMASDGTYAIPDSGSLVLDFGSSQTVGSIAIYNGYTNRDDGTYTLRDASSNVLGAWTISTASGGTNDGADSFWLLFDPPVTTTALSIEATSSDFGSTVSYREIQVMEPSPPECDDGLDNDGDGDTDLADVDCADATDPVEGWVGMLSAQAISDLSGYLSSPGTPGSNPGSTLADGDLFGVSVARLGDLDGDGVQDIAVGASFDDTGGTDRGAVYILFLNPDGTVKARTKIADGLGGLPPNSLADGDLFGGEGVEPIGDVDGDGTVDLAVGAQTDDTGFADAGAVWILFLNADGTVKLAKKITEAQGVFGLDGNDRFGSDIAAIGDLDGDGISELAVGAFGADTPGFTDDGVVWLLYLGSSGDVRNGFQIGQGLGGFEGILEDSANFGRALSRLGDLDGDGVPELAVGASRMGPDTGSVWVLFLNPSGGVDSEVQIADGAGGFPPGLLAAGDRFGRGVGAPGDVDGDGVADLLVGSDRDGTLGPQAGALWALRLASNGQVQDQRKLTLGSGLFASSVDAVGDVDGDGVGEWLAGDLAADLGGTDRGGAWLMEVNAQAAVCGDGALDPEEACDDGGNGSGDGCSDTCELEARPPVYFEAEMTLDFPLRWGTLSFDNLPPADAASVGVGVSGTDLHYLRVPGGAVAGNGTVSTTSSALGTSRIAASLGSGTIFRRPGGLAGAIPVPGLWSWDWLNGPAPTFETSGFLPFAWGCCLVPGVRGTVGVGGGGDVGIMSDRFARFTDWATGSRTVMDGSLSGGLIGSTTTFTVQGFVHGPASLTSTAAQTGGVLQLVTPTKIEILDSPGGNVVGHRPLTARLTIHLVPEPGTFSLLASGALLMLLIGRRRMRRRWQCGR